MKISDILKGEKIKITKKGRKKYYSIISVLEELEVSTRPRKYWYDAKKKIEKKDKEVFSQIEQLKVEANDGKLRVLDCADRQTIEKILKLLPSRKIKEIFENKKTIKKKDSKNNEITKKEVKKKIKKEVKKDVKKELKKETKNATKKVSKKKMDKNEKKVEKEAKKIVKKETKKITKKISPKKIIKKAKKENKNIDEVIKEEVKNELNKEVKKKKCGIICKIVKIFA